MGITLPIHLQPYYAALDVNVASIMPYYSVPLTLDMENSAIGSKATLQDLLRDQMGFEGIIQTDWGMIWAIQEALGTMTGEEVSDEEAILIGVTQSRVDGIGGESIRLIDQMEQYTNEGKIDEDILTAAATRIVKVKLQMGVFAPKTIAPLRGFFKRHPLIWICIPAALLIYFVYVSLGWNLWVSVSDWEAGNLEASYG